MKYAVVTGASTGIGKETAICLSKNGFEVFLLGRNKQGLEKTSDLIKENGGKSKIYILDLTDLKTVKDTINKIVSGGVKINLLANIAGIWHGDDKVYVNIDYKNFDEAVILNTMKVGIIAPMLLVKYLLPNFSRDALVVNLSGTFESGGKGWLPYFVSKRALEDFTVGLADDLKENNIRVLGISPSDTATENYKKFFPECIDDSQDPKFVAKTICNLYFKNKETGIIYVIKENKLSKKFHA